MIASLRTKTITTLALLAPLGERTPAQTAAPAEASVPKFELAPRFRGLVHLGEGEFGTPAEAAVAGMVCYDGLWVPKSKTHEIRTWETEAKRIRGWQDAYEVRTEHYRIETDLAPHLVELQVGPFLDATQRAYAAIFADSFGLSGEATGEKLIRIYRSYQEYAQHETADGQQRPRSQPAFIADGQLVTFWDETDQDSFYQHVFHEGARPFLQGLLPGTELPKWLDEGMASLFESCTWSPARGEVEHDGMVPVTRLAVARAILGSAQVSGETSLPRRLFLDVPDDKFAARECALAATFVHYLAFRDEGRQKAVFATFLRDPTGSSQKPIEETWRETTSTDFDEVALGWRDHVMAMELPRAARWCLIRPHDAGSLDLRDRDRLASIDGVPVFDAGHFHELWRDRPKDRAFELVLVREADGPATSDSARLVVRVEVPARSPLEIEVTATTPRAFCLVD